MEARAPDVSPPSPSGNPDPTKPLEAPSPISPEPEKQMELKRHRTYRDLSELGEWVVPAKGHKPGTPVPYDRVIMWPPRPKDPKDIKLPPPPGKGAMDSNLRPIPKPKPPPLDAEEKKFAAKFAVRQSLQRVTQYMERSSIVLAAEEREAKTAATKGSSAGATDVVPSATTLAALTFPLPAALDPRPHEVVNASAAQQKRKRANDDEGDEETRDAKRPRVGSDSPPPSRAVDRPVAGKPARGGLTGATATNDSKLTTSAASRVPRTRLKATLSKCLPPPRGPTVVGNKKVEQALLNPPTLGLDGRVPLRREHTPPQLVVEQKAAPPSSAASATPRLARGIPFRKPAAVVTAAGPNPPSNPPSTPNALSAGSSALATPRLARKIPFHKPAAVVATAGAPSPPSTPPSTSNASSAGPSTPTPAPAGRPPVRVALSRKPASVFAGGAVSTSAPTPSSLPTPPPSSLPPPSPPSSSLPQPQLSPPSSPTLAAACPPRKKIEARLPATAYGQARVSREVLPVPAPKPVPRESTAASWKQRWLEVFGEEAPAGMIVDKDAPTPTRRLTAEEVLERYPKLVFGDPQEGTFGLGLARAVEVAPPLRLTASEARKLPVPPPDYWVPFDSADITPGMLFPFHMVWQRTDRPPAVPHGAAPAAGGANASAQGAPAPAGHNAVGGQGNGAASA